MKTFTLLLQDATHSEQFDDVSSFVGEDASGSFGILPGHARMMTALVMGLARFRRAGNEAWLYIATPGAMLYFHNNQLSLTTRHLFIDTDYMRISQALEVQLLEEETQLHHQKQTLRRMEEDVLKYLWKLGRN